jgi:hypothetical protein
MAEDERNPGGTRRVEGELSSSEPLATRRVDDGASATGTRRVENAAELTPPRVKLLAEIDPGTLLFGRYLVAQTLQEHEHDQPGLYLATLPDGEEVVVKVHPRDFPPAPRILERLPQLTHRNVLRTREAGEQDGYFYEVQEYCLGGSAQSLIPPVGAPLTQERLRWVFGDFLAQLNAGLCYLHDQEIIHRDVKPANIYIRKAVDGDVYVLGDFDIASELSRERSSRFTKRTWLTLEYAAPEQFPQLSDSGLGRLSSRITRKSDYWSLGVVLLELLAGTTTLHQVGPELIQGFHLKGKRVEIPEGLPENIALLLRGLLIRDDELRWGGEEVTRWLKQQTTGADRASVERDTSLAGAPHAAPYKLEELAAYSLGELADAMALKPGPALEDLMGGEILINWIGQFDTNLAREIRRERDRWRLEPEVALQSAIQRLDPAHAYVFNDGSEARSSMEWAQHAGRLSQLAAHPLDLNSQALHRRLAMWLRLKPVPEEELAAAVEKIAAHGGQTRGIELLFLLDPARPLQLGPKLYAQTPADLVNLAYGTIQDWNRGTPEAYTQAMARWQDGTVDAWLRQRGNPELAATSQELRRSLASAPAAAFETMLRQIQPTLPKVKLVVDARSIARRVVVPYADAKVFELSYRTEGPGIPFGALRLAKPAPGVNLALHLITEREGKLELTITAGDELSGTGRYQGELMMESGVAELARGAVHFSYSVGYPHLNTALRVLSGAALGALLLGGVRLGLSLLGLKDYSRFASIDIGTMWDDAINLRFATLNLVLVVALLAVAGLIGFRIWLTALRDSEP